MSDKKSLIASSKRVPFDEWLSKNLGSLTEDEQEAVLRGREHSETLKHRGWWSKTLIIIVAVINIVSLFVVVAIGFGWMKYEGALTVPAIIGANFAQTWALTKIAMKFYFNLNKQER
jgi:hypothetical protein